MRIQVVALAAACLAAPYGIAFAGSVDDLTQIVAFGDSLSDPGNASIATLGDKPGPGYATRTIPDVPFPVGYYTNPQSGSGPSGLWIDQLAGRMGVTDPMPFLAPGGGTNYAFASAQTGGTTNPATGAPSLNSQVGLYLTATGGAASSTSLYTFWGGGDNLLFPSSETPQQAANDIENQILTLHSAGAQTFLWLNLPALGDIPALNTNPVTQAAGNLFSSLFDQQWSADITALHALGIDVVGVDINDLFAQMLADPAAYGFTNVTDACNATPGCDPNTFAFWDTEHPTTEADSLIADVAYADLTAVPEPAGYALFMLSLIHISEPTRP